MWTGALRLLVRISSSQLERINVNSIRPSDLLSQIEAAAVDDDVANQRPADRYAIDADVDAAAECISAVIPCLRLIGAQRMLPEPGGSLMKRLA